MKTLSEIHEDAKKELTDEKAINMKFLFLARQENPEVTLKECREFLGFSSKDEKQDANLNQKFRNGVLVPLRNFLTKYKFGLANMKEADAVWKQKNSNEENQKRKEAINEMLPKVTRDRSESEDLDLCEILGLESK